MPVLRFEDMPSRTSGGRRVRVTWQDGSARRVAESDVSNLEDERDSELIRWYLEEYAEFCVDPAPAIARDAETRLAELGMELFRRVFASPDAIGIWGRAQDRLREVRVEVDADPSEGLGLPWELLRDPGRDEPLALAAGEFVRTHLQSAGHPELPEPSESRAEKDRAAPRRGPVSPSRAVIK